VSEDQDQEPDWLAELAKGGDAVRRQIELLVQGAQQFVRDGQQGIVSGGPVPPFQQRVVRAVGAAVRELGSARQPVAHQRSASLSSTCRLVSSTQMVTFRPASCGLSQTCCPPTCKLPDGGTTRSASTATGGA